MTALVIIAILLGFPLFLGLFFRVPSAHIFFSLMAGELLARYFGHDLEEILKSITLSARFAEFAEVIIMVFPMLLTAFLLRGTMKKRHMIWQSVPLAITGVVFATFALAVVPENIQSLVYQEKIGQYLIELDGAVIAVVVCAQLVALWVQHRKTDKDEKKRK